MIHCSLSYHKSKVEELPIFAIGVRDGIYDNATFFVTPPMAQAVFEALIQDYSDKRSAYENGGSAQKGPYQHAKQLLMNGLDTQADYVNGVANGDENLILLAGFVPTKGYRSSAPSPVQPTGVVLKRPGTGVITAECANQKVATNYICIVTINNPLPSNVKLNDSGQLVYTDDKGTAPASNTSESSGAPVATSTSGVISAYIDFSPGRRKEFKGLQLGSRYYFSFIAANAQGVSTMSDAVSIICG